MGERVNWPPILERAAEIVESYDTGVTLRQLFYRLVAEVLVANTTNTYKQLSSRTARARREGTFPALVDRTRTIHQLRSWTSPAAASRWLASVYRRDRTEGQAVRLYLGVEKAGLVNQLATWFEDLGVPIVALSGYSSQTFVDEVAVDVDRSTRSAVLLYAGDFDPSGEDIDRDFVVRTGCFAKVHRIALNAEQVEAFDLPPAMGKASDSRASAFVGRHGRLVQVELDALAPDVLRGLYTDAIADYWDDDAYQAVIEREQAERLELER